MFSKHIAFAIFLVISHSVRASVIEDCLKSRPNNTCLCNKGFINLNTKCLNQWLLNGLFIGVAALLVLIIIILGWRLAKARNAYKHPAPVSNSIFREDRSTSTSSMPRHETKDASTDTESQEALNRTSLARMPMFGAPFSYTNTSFESNEKSYLPDFMKRKNYDQNTFEEIPLHDARQVDRSGRDDSRTIFSIKRPVHSYYSKASDKSF